MVALFKKRSVGNEPLPYVVDTQRVSFPSAWAMQIARYTESGGMVPYRPVARADLPGQFISPLNSLYIHMTGNSEQNDLGRAVPTVQRVSALPHQPRRYRR